MPHDALPDSTLPLALDGYRFIGERRRKLGADAFACRLLLRPAVCIGGPSAAALFYDTEFFRRAGVVPARIRKTLLGEGGVHGLDGAAHRHRKAMHLSFMGPQCLAPFRAAMDAEWQAGHWARAGEPVFEAAQKLLFQVVARWAGVPFGEAEIDARTADLAAMVDGFGGIGPRYWRGRLARRRAEAWMIDMVQAARRGEVRPEPGTALDVIARHRQRDGTLLDEHTAAVEMLNAIRPVMAAAYFIELMAAALCRFPKLRASLAADADARECFVEETRRFYPFTPFLGAEACRDVAWNGYLIGKGTLVVLDVYGIHRDERIWPRPEAFDPKRFLNWDQNPFTLLQQGGGDHASGHRCAGEWLTLETLRAAARALARVDFAYESAALDFDLTRIPARLTTPVLIAARRH